MFNTLHITNNEEETINLGFRFAKELKPGDNVCFYGELGAGKTQFIKGICNFFKVDEIVSSPTFTIINEYAGIFNHHDISIYHIDLYRLKNNHEIADIGLSEIIDDKDSVKLIEWAEKAEDFTKEPHFTVSFSLDDDNENLRKIELSRT